METTRREFLKSVGAGALALGAGSLLSPLQRAWAAQSGRRPNFVFVLADDWGWGDLGCYGHDILRTPNLDKLAKQGTLFTRFYVNGPVCSPSRCGFMTGQFPSRHRIFGHFADHEINAKRGMPDWLDPSAVTLARLMKQAGYVTGHFGKWHLGSGKDAPEPSAYGVDDYRVFVGNPQGWRDAQFDTRSSELVVDEAIRFVETHKEKPFFANVWLKDTHAYLNPTDEMMKPYESLGGALKVYYGAATNADAQLGRLFAKLDELGLSDNTVVIFTSDNGPEDIHIANASHSGVGTTGPFRGRKRSLYEGGIRTPFIIRWPGRTPAGRVNDTTVLSGVDMLPSLCSLAGVSSPREWKLDGEDLSAALRGRPVKRTTPLFWEFRYWVHGDTINRNPMIAVREGDWKLLVNPDGSRVELYDIPRDSMELDNLADRKPEVAKRLKDKALAWFKTLPEGPIEERAGKNDYRWPKDVGPVEE